MNPSFVPVIVKRVARLAVVCALLAGCSKDETPPTCDEALNGAATRLRGLRGLGLGSVETAIAACENEQWPYALRVCIQAAKNQTQVRDCIVSGVSKEEAPNGPAPR